MRQSKNQKSRPDMQHGHQNEMPKKGQSPNDSKNQPKDNPQKQGVNDSKEGQERQGIGTEEKTRN
jgi:hypothetical protein